MNQTAVPWRPHIEPALGGTLEVHEVAEITPMYWAILYEVWHNPSNRDQRGLWICLLDEEAGTGRVYEDLSADWRGDLIAKANSLHGAFYWRVRSEAYLRALLAATRLEATLDYVPV